MSDLLLDLGNTRLKWARRDGDRFDRHGSVDWAQFEVDAGAFSAEVAAIDPQRIGLSQVVSGQRRAAVLGRLAQAAPGIAIAFARSMSQRGRLRIAYAEPDKLGVDRFLALLAATRESRASLIVGAGTALTIDALAQDGTHLGGVISSGLSLMQSALAEVAPLIRIDPRSRFDGFASTTTDAMRAGAWFALRGAVMEARARFVERCGREPQILVHGGDGADLAASIAGAKWRPDLVFEGLAEWLDGDSAA